LQSALKFPVIPKYPKCLSNFRLSARASIRLTQPVDVDVMGERRSMPPAASRTLASLSARVSLKRLWSPMSPPSFPRTFPCSGALFPPWGPSGWFPRFFGTVKNSDFLPPLPRCFVSFAPRYRRSPRILLPRAQGAAPVGQGLFTGFPNPGSSTETTGPPRFLE
jgi:hypothetical protein